MYSIEGSFQTGIAICHAALVASLYEIYRPGIEVELGKKLGRRLTADERVYLIRESLQKAQAEREQEQANQWIRQQADREIIHDFVWNSS